MWSNLKAPRLITNSVRKLKRGSPSEPVLMSKQIASASSAQSNTKTSSPVGPTPSNVATLSWAPMQIMPAIKRKLDDNINNKVKGTASTSGNARVKTLVAATANAAKVVMLTPLPHAGGADASTVNIAPLSQHFEEQQLQTWVQLVSCCAFTFLQGETIAYLAALVLHLAILISVVSPMWKRPTLQPVLLAISASIMCSTAAAVGSISTPAHAVVWLVVLVVSPFFLLVVWDKNLLKRRCRHYYR